MEESYFDSEYIEDDLFAGLEVFKVPEDYEIKNEDGELIESGWYYWFCFPGCLPDSDPYGPFDSEEEALEDARNY